MIHKDNQGFSRIHVADIANAIIYLIQNKNKIDFHQIINIADDEPCAQIEVIKYGYQLLGLKMPKKILFEEAKTDLSPIAQSFWIEMLCFVPNLRGRGKPMSMAELCCRTGSLDWR